MVLEKVVVGNLQVNCYILACDKNSSAIVIDPGDETEKIKRALGKFELRPAFIINTHGHMDHIYGDDDFGLTVYAHRGDAPLLKDQNLNLSVFLGRPFQVKSFVKTLEDGQVIKLEGLELEVIHTPGHTPGGICLLLKKPENKILFSGDSLFCEGIGRTDFPGASEALLITSIKEKLFKLSDDTIVLPGHGPASTIGREKKSNPFLN